MIWVARALACAAVAGSLTLTGCSDATEELDPAEPAGSTQDSLDITLEAPGEVRAGTLTTLRIHVANPGPTEVVIITTRPAFDFVVLDASGTEVWRGPLAHVDVADAHTIAPQESLTFAEDWALVDNSGQPLTPGEYSVRAYLYVQGPPIESEVSSVTITA